MTDTALSPLGEHGGASMPEPEMVSLSKKLMERNQSGDDDGMLAIIAELWPMLQSEFEKTLSDKDTRTLTYAAPQIASLAERVGWLRK